MYPTRFDKKIVYESACSAFAKERLILQDLDRKYHGTNENLNERMRAIDNAVQRLHAFTTHPSYLEVEEGALVVTSSESSYAPLSKAASFALVLENSGTGVGSFVLAGEAVQIYLLPKDFFEGKKLGESYSFESGRPGDGGPTVTRTILDIY